jgi:hypothetical protein
MGPFAILMGLFHTEQVVCFGVDELKSIPTAIEAKSIKPKIQPLID